ncbi:lysine-rich arabinogalactan protein 19-like [Eurytemora carolleeae]|uniref:lysine-rich arabinogalactan protein 19-like n=1 Tax=Eurytemora carolleeae TaxID=1294199 RepID=UPI000C793E68|nr:lysine-rich arabinogalactan protein 19-like [Eurytemora carolleeae]|eukprot:XP_023346705.1 lysine-rich arabinogalactan protein 19-like [Eurytemora affinis]
MESLQSNPENKEPTESPRSSSPPLECPPTPEQVPPGSKTPPPGPSKEYSKRVSRKLMQSINIVSPGPSKEYYKRVSRKLR